MMNYGHNMTLCLLCQKYIDGCNWSRSFKAVEGWTAYVTHKKNGKIARAWVGWCPECVFDEKAHEVITTWNTNDGMEYITKQYGFITELRYATLRYHLMNNYVKGKENE